MGVTYIGAEAPGGPARAVLGDLTDTLEPCFGGCGLRLLRIVQWGKLTKPQRKRLISLGVNRQESYGRCSKCTAAGKAKGPSKYTPGSQTRKVTAEMRAGIPDLWEEVRASGGSLRDLGKRLGVTRERARQLVKELELPENDTWKDRADYFIEELEHLASFGLGVYEIAQRLELRPDALVRKVDDLHREGKTTVKFEAYHRRYSQKAAA